MRKSMPGEQPLLRTQLLRWLAVPGALPRLRDHAPRLAAEWTQAVREAVANMEE